MDFKTFKLLVMGSIPVGTVLQNPGGGTSIIASYSDSGISYKRKNSTIRVSFRDLFDAYSHFRGQEVSSSDLKKYKLSVYDSTKGGHSCNCTFLFMVLCHLPLVVGIEGNGKKGCPFFINIPN
jgi:hypothetical protein